MAGILGGRSLGVVEVGRDGDDSSVDVLAEIALSSFLHLGEDEGSDLRRRVAFALHFDPGVSAGVLDNLVGHVLLVVLDGLVVKSSADQSLGGIDCVLGVGDGLSLSGGSNKLFSVLGEGDNGGGGPVALGIFNDFGSTAFHKSHAGVGGTKIDADDGSFSCRGEGLQKSFGKKSLHVFID